MMPPVCVKCEVEYRCIKNEVLVPTLIDGVPVEIHEGDEWECLGCDARIVIGFGAPWSMHGLYFPEAIRVAERDGLVRKNHREKWAPERAQ